MIPAEQAHLHVAATSHPGMSGKNNEDRYAVSAYRINTGKPTPSMFAIIADGIGGHRAGEVAAELAVEIISTTVRKSDASNPVKILEEAVIHASQAIYEQSEQDIHYKGMGATCACSWIIGDQLYTVCVGDTRIYLIRGKTIRQLSTDHTWIQEAIEYGALSPEEAQGHPNAHVIRRYLGSRQTVVPDFRLRLHPKESDTRARANQGMRLLPGDLLILCSDGLTDLVADHEILASFDTLDREEALDELVNLANQRGGHDNITIVALQTPKQSLRTTPAVSSRQNRRLGLACLGMGALLTLGVVMLAGLYWLFIRPVSMPPPATTIATTISTPQATFRTTTTAPPTASSFPPASITPLPGLVATVSPVPTPLSATLTPWPTNTSAP